jgi:hypothetical protein
MGVREADFWLMSIDEIERQIKSYRKTELLRLQEKAVYDYTLADLIGKSISRLYSSSAKMPELSEAYPSVFKTEEIQEQKQAKKDELSALRFRLFANSHNTRFKEEVSNRNE